MVVWADATQWVGSSNPVASTNCGFDAATGYQSATGNAACFVRDTSTNMPVVVDYTAFRYTTYTFTLQMLESGLAPIQNNNVNPHGAVKICNRDGTSQYRGGSPELWHIDRNTDMGYGLYNGGWGGVSTAEMRTVSAGLWPDVPRVWKVVMEWDAGAYKMVSWQIDGTEIPDVSGKNSGCGADPSTSGQVKIWAYGGNTIFRVKDFAVTQAPDPTSSLPPNAWVLGTAGSVCNAVCSAYPSTVCDGAMQATLDTCAKLQAVVSTIAGMTCSTTLDAASGCGEADAARNYAGSPFINNVDGCYFWKVGGPAESSCDANNSPNHRPLCYCASAAPSPPSSAAPRTRWRSWRRRRWRMRAGA